MAQPTAVKGGVFQPRASGIASGCNCPIFQAKLASSAYPSSASSYQNHINPNWGTAAHRGLLHRPGFWRGPWGRNAVADAGVRHVQPPGVGRDRDRIGGVRTLLLGSALQGVGADVVSAV